MNETDKVIEEIREARRILSAQHNHDPVRYIDCLKSLDKKYSKQAATYENTGNSTETTGAHAGHWRISTRVILHVRPPQPHASLTPSRSMSTRAS